MFLMGSAFCLQDMEIAAGCFRHLRQLFQELEETRPFEILKGQADRVSYLCTKQAKVVAMTCTHAALKRREFINLGLKYDNIVMEEAGQVRVVLCACQVGMMRQISVQHSYHKRHLRYGVSDPVTVRLCQKTCLWRAYKA